jgi:exosome complex component RRP45
MNLINRIFGTTCCDITSPKISRPSEGIIELSLDICCATEKWLDSYDRSLPEEGIHCLRLLERTIRDSYCLDTESLCLVTNEKVWRIKCHLICLNFDGNLTQASSIAAIASLSHFRFYININ